MSLNQAQLIGNVGKDPECRYTGSGKAVTNFSIATNERWKNAAGEQQNKTTWHRCVAWGKLAEIIQQYVKKGQQIFVQGRIENSEYVDRENIKRYKTEIVVDKMTMLGKKDGGRQETPAQDDFDAPGGERVSQPQQPQAAPQPEQDFESDIPF